MVNPQKRKSVDVAAESAAPLRKLKTLLDVAGACAFGVAKAETVPLQQWCRFQKWLDSGMHAGMTYMERWPESRRDPRLLLHGARSVISIAFNYRQPNPYPEIATYALGEDYHKVLRRRLKSVVKELSDEFGGQWRICIDSAPILERYWALKCGIGFRSPVHGNIVVPRVGSMVFLAELITTLECNLKGTVSSDNVVETSGAYERDAGAGVCPTGALQSDGTVDSNRCINYLTIEKREPLSDEEREMCGHAVFGCDICQRVCSENKSPYPGVLPEFTPMPGLEDFLNGEKGEF